nr:immunoglobulin heavy chain junction region [Macaca mulatta]
CVRDEFGSGFSTW